MRAWSYEEARKRVLNVAMHMRPRHRRWVEEFVERSDRLRSELEKERQDMKDMLYVMEQRGWLQQLSKERAERDRPAA